MPRIHDISAYHEALHQQWQAGATQPQMLQFLNNQGVQISLRTFQRHLNDLGLTGKNPGIKTYISDQVVVDEIYRLWQAELRSDDQIAATLRSYNHHISTRTVQEIRLHHGWVRSHRTEDPEASAARFELAKSAVWEAITTGPGRLYGRNLMWSYLRSQRGLNIRRLDVADALSIIHQFQGRSRALKFRALHRRQANFPGPNWVWHVDGHTKLQNWGIDIYGAIDGYSRRIIWLWVGPSALSQVCVAKQYLKAIQGYGFRPRFIRSDRGTETALMADAHYSLEVQHLQLFHNHNQEVNPLRLRECYLYGKSTTNQRIESWWLRLILAQTRAWMVSHSRRCSDAHLARVADSTAPLTLSCTKKTQYCTSTNPHYKQDYFRHIEAEDVYDGSRASDRAILLFIFLPIIRKEINSFVTTWNAHPIRKDNTRPDQVPGRPDELFLGYTNEPNVIKPNYAKPINFGAVEALLRGYNEYSKSGLMLEFRAASLSLVQNRLSFGLNR